MANKKLKDNKPALYGILIVILAIIGLYSYFKYDEIYPSTDNAYVNAKLINVATKVSGYIDQINVHDNQLVHKGEVLFTINSKDYKLAINKANAIYLSALAQIKMAQQDMEVQLGLTAKDTQQYKLGLTKLKRYKELYSAKTISYQQYQEVQTVDENFKTQLDIDNKKYQQLQTKESYLQAQLQVAKDGLDLAQSNLGYTKYIAPVNGYITGLKTLSNGEFVMAGVPVFGIVDISQWWVDANFKETQLQRVRTGQIASVELDIYGHHKFSGIVQSVSEASGDTFSLLPAQNATGNWVKVTRRFTVKVKLQPQKSYPLRVGASADITIDTRSRQK